MLLWTQWAGCVRWFGSLIITNLRSDCPLIYQRYSQDFTFGPGDEAVWVQADIFKFVFLLIFSEKVFFCSFFCSSSVKYVFHSHHRAKLFHQSSVSKHFITNTPSFGIFVLLCLMLLQTCRLMTLLDGITLWLSKADTQILTVEMFSHVGNKVALSTDFMSFSTLSHLCQSDQRKKIRLLLFWWLLNYFFFFCFFSVKIIAYNVLLLHLLSH